MQIRPILSTLRRHKTAAALIVLEIALSCAIVTNAVFLISRRLERMDRPSGVVENELIRIQITGIGKDANPDALTKEDVASLRALPGVKAASASNQVPYGNSSWNSSVNLTADQTHQSLNSTIYFGDEELVETLGVTLIAGRDFTPDDFVDFDALMGESGETQSPPVIITRTMAAKLFPDESALGKSIYITNDAPSQIVGIVDHLIRPSEAGGRAFEFATILPVRVPYTVGGNYLLRVEPERRQETITAAVAALEHNNPNRIVLNKQTMAEMRADFYRADSAMAWLLMAVCIALFVVTALGIVGLASFWVQQRTRQIGIRRALGASRGQILRYFQTENFLLATLGVILGMVLAYAINLWLMKHYELPRLPAYFLPLGAVALWTLGQLAVLGPALRAAAVPPAVATRSL